MCMNPYIKDTHKVWNRTRCKLHDTIATARFRAPDLPKSLGVIGSILTDVHAWKNDHDGNKIATKGQDDDERLDYCHLDVAVNVEIIEPLESAARANGAFRPLHELLKPTSWPADRLWNLYEFDNLRQELWVEAHRRGLRVDQNLRSRMEMLLTVEVKHHYDQLQQLAPMVGLKTLEGLAADDDDVEDDDERADRDATPLGANGATAVDNIKPGSTDNIRKLLYETWKLGCPPTLSEREFLTESGLPSTSDVVLRAHLAQMDKRRRQAKTDAERAFIDRQSWFLRHLRQYRRKRNKGLGTILVPLRLNSVDKKRGLVWSDGRVRSTIGTLITAVGRGNSRKPNLQNIGAKKGAGVWFERAEIAHRFGIPWVGDGPDMATIGEWQTAWKKYVKGQSDEFDPRYLDHRCDYMDEDKFRRRYWTDKQTGKAMGDGKILIPFKDLFISEDDNWMFGFDLDAIHMVIIANEWQIPAVVDAYEKGDDFHNRTASDLGYDPTTGRNMYHEADGWPGGKYNPKIKPKSEAKDKRDFAKTFGYTSFYGADVMTKLKVITSQENEYGELPYCDYSIEEMETQDHRWKTGQPEWEDKWHQMCEEYRDNGGWMESYVLHRRSGSLEDGKMNAVVNYGVLSTEQDCMGLTEFEVCSRLPFGYDGPHRGGFVMQIHDALYTEHKKSDYREVMGSMTDAIATVGKRIQQACGWKYPPTGTPDCGPTMRYC